MVEEDVESRSPLASEPSVPSGSSSATSASLETVSDSSDDVFDTSDDHDEGVANNNSNSRRNMLSDLPAVQRQHMTNGYREGLTDSKAKSMQGGFDQGYPIGHELGLKVGQVLGVLEGFLASFGKDATKLPEELVQLYRKAKSELTVSQLLDGLDEEKLGDPGFGIEDLPVKTKETVQTWENLVANIMRR